VTLPGLRSINASRTGAFASEQHVFQLREHLTTWLQSQMCKPGNAHYSPEWVAYSKHANGKPGQSGDDEEPPAAKKRKADESKAKAKPKPKPKASNKRRKADADAEEAEEEEPEDSEDDSVSEEA